MSGPTYKRSSCPRSAIGFRSLADARVDDGEVDARGHVGQRVREHERALKHVLRRDPVRDVDHLGLGRDALDHAAAGAGEVVLEAEIGQEGDELACDAASLTAATRPSRSWLSASATTVETEVTRLL